MRATIEDSGDWSERLLAGSVPNLKLNYLILNVDDKSAEFDTYGDLMLYFEVIVHYSGKQTALSHAYNPNLNQNKLPVSPIIMSL